MDKPSCQALFSRLRAKNKHPPKRVLVKERAVTLAELRSAAGGLQAYFLRSLHTRIAGQETGLLEDGTVVGIDEQQSAGNAVAQGAGLTGHTAALDGGDDIDLTGVSVAARADGRPS